jgi:hypothetical protein
MRLAYTSADTQLWFWEWIEDGGFVTLPRRERERSAAQDLLGRRDCRPPRVHRLGAKRAVRLGRGEMTLDVKGVL